MPHHEYTKRIGNIVAGGCGRLILAVKGIKAKLPFGLSLTPEQRQAVSKLGTKSGGFVSESLAAAELHPDILPASFDKAEFKKDAELFEQLLKIYLAVVPVAEMIEHTTMAVGGEAFSAARTVYKYVKTGAETTPGLQSVAAKLGERFKQTKTGEIVTAIKPSAG